MHLIPLLVDNHLHPRLLQRESNWLFRFENFGKFFQGTVLRLDEEEVDERLRSGQLMFPTNKNGMTIQLYEAQRFERKRYLQTQTYPKR